MRRMIRDIVVRMYHKVMFLNVASSAVQVRRNYATTKKWLYEVYWAFIALAHSVNVDEYLEQILWAFIDPLDLQVSTLEAYMRLCC